MKRWKSWIQGGLSLIMTLWSLTALAQNGHIIEDIAVSPQGGRPTLVLFGSFNPLQPPDVQIEPGASELETVISMSNTLLNSFQVPPQLTFPSGEIETIQLQEDLSNIALRMNIKARVPLAINWERSSSNTKQLTFLLIEKFVATEAQIAEDTTMQPNETLDLVDSSQTTDGKPSKAEAMLDTEMESLSDAPAIDPVDPVLLHPVSALLAYQRPTRVNISILNASPLANNANRLAILLDRHKRMSFEDRTGMKLEITNISAAQEELKIPKTKIYFRPNYLISALALAEAIPGEQVVEQMGLMRRGRLGIDVEIYVGANFE